MVDAATSMSEGGSSAGSTTGSAGTSTSNSGSGALGWKGLDCGARVAIIVAIVVGVPPIFVGLWAFRGRSVRLIDQRVMGLEKIMTMTILGRSSTSLAAGHSLGWERGGSILLSSDGCTILPR